MTASVTDRGRIPWMDEGACRREDPDLFFPIGEGEASAGQIDQAVSICHDCDVEAVCLRFALTSGIKEGIWGGRTEQERLAMIRTYRANRTRRAVRRHPSAPDRPPLNKLLAPGAGLVDRIRDHLSGRGRD